MFELGKTYLTQAGREVTIVEEGMRGTGYDWVRGGDGVCRYDRDQDRGRVTASAFDMSDPRNLVEVEVNVDVRDRSLDFLDMLEVA